MYESFIQGDPDLSLLQRGVDPALLHAGDHRRLLEVHERHAALATSGHYPDLAPIGPLLMRRLADARTLRSAADDLRRSGGKAPGPNGNRLDDLGDDGLWSLCRSLAEAIRAGTYRPGPERRIQVPKEDGGFRQLTLRNIEDRVVGRALVRILQPLLDPQFGPFSFGFRPRRGCLAALAAALACAESRRATWWLCADLHKAFDTVPFARLMQACRLLLPEEICRFIELISATRQRKGQRQGSPESPLLFNVFADRNLDRPWHRRHPDLPLFRYADDLLLVCPSQTVAMAAAADLDRLTMGAGVPLKRTAAEGIVDLHGGQALDWLGYRLQRQEGCLSIRIAPQAIQKLTRRLAQAHLLPHAPLRAIQIVRGWLNYLGPCHAFENRKDVIGRIREIAADLAFEEMPPDRQLLRWWHSAQIRWQRALDHATAVLPQRLQAIGVRVPLC